MCISGLQFHFLFFALHKCCHSETLRKILPSQQINCSLSSRPRESKIEIWKFWIETLRVCGKRKYPFIVDLTNFSLQFLQHFFKAVLGIFGCICRRLPLVWRRLCSDEFLEKLQPSETRQNKTIKKQTFSLSTRHSDEAETGRQATRECHYSVGDIICPSTRAAFPSLSCSLCLALWQWQRPLWLCAEFLLSASISKLAYHA